MTAARDQAVCVRQWDWSETSQTVSLLTRGHGLVRAVAKGSRRPTAPFSGGIELLTRAEIGLIVKPTSDLALLTEWDLAEHFPVLRQSLPVYHAGLYGAELVVRMISDHDPHPDVFDALLVLLRSLRSPGDVGPGVLAFQRRLLRASGYEPVLDRDARSGGSLDDERVALFVPELGGVISASGGRSAASAEGRPLQSWPVRRSTLDVLTGTRPDGGTPQDVERAGMLLAAYIRTLIGASPRTLGLVYPVLASKSGAGEQPGKASRAG
ncbi:MAG: DNA repair protein RecO [Phycisphaerales bacterium]|nr:DNA repair protein RecO [Phycisphaerales bacterium]